MEFQFIHCGDLHLGCYPNHIEDRFNDFFLAFRRVIDYAVLNKINLILVSGDMFHLKNINSRTLQKTIELLDYAKSNGIEVIAIEGNHDRAFYIDEESWLSFLNSQGYIKLLNLKIENGKIVFSNYDNLTGNVIETDTYKIVGLGYLGGSTDKYVMDLKKGYQKSDKFTIFMMHAAVNRLKDQEMGDIKKEVIDEALGGKVDYIALGHIHNKYSYDDYIYNPGSLENIRLKDGINAQDKGFYHVRVKDKVKEVMFINSNPRVIHFESVDVTGLTSPSDVEEYILSKEYKFNKGDMLDFRLYGKSNFNPYLINSFVINSIQDKYELLYSEFTNHINLTVGQDTSHEGMNINEIIKNYITDDLKVNYPHLDNYDDITSQMQSIADGVLNEDDKDITNKIIKMGVKL